MDGRGREKWGDNGQNGNRGFVYISKSQGGGEMEWNVKMEAERNRQG